MKAVALLHSHLSYPTNTQSLKRLLPTSSLPDEVSADQGTVEESTS
jgi:hypothetical protein